MIKKTLYFGNPAYLNLRDRQLVLRLPEVEQASNLSATFKQKAERTIPIEDIGIVVLDHQRITITQGLLAKLLDNECAVITCDERRMPTELLLPLTGNTLQSERFRQQIESSLPLRKQLWQQTIQQKILNQAAVLQRCSHYETRCMKVWSEEVKSGDTSNLEARAAVYYWQHFFPTHPLFVRDREATDPNQLFNYGYAILRAVIARALVVSGLLPTLGLHHHNRYNAYCLADDIMEPYRPFVDELVFQLVAQYDFWAENAILTTELKRELLSIPTLDVIIGGKRSPLMVAAGITTASLAKCFAGEQRKLIFPQFA